MLSKKNKQLIYVVIALVTFFVFFTRGQFFTPLKSGIVRVTTLPIKILSFPFQELKKILYYHRTFNEYRKVKKERDALQSRLVGLEEVLLENTRLEKLLDFRRRLIYTSVVANVIGRDPSLWSSSIIIDKGEADGVEQGFPVVSAEGIVGKVAEVGKKVSKVILLTDPQFSVGVLVQRSRESGLVSGSLSGYCRMKYIEENADVRVGDKVISSKLSSSFPESLLVGEVFDVRISERGLSKEALVKPAVAISQLEEVLIIFEKEKTDFN